jgi:hypothetical protein
MRQGGVGPCTIQTPGASTDPFQKLSKVDIKPGRSTRSLGLEVHGNCSDWLDPDPDIAAGRTSTSLISSPQPFIHRESVLSCPKRSKVLIPQYPPLRSVGHRHQKQSCKKNAMAKTWFIPVIPTQSFLFFPSRCCPYGCPPQLTHAIKRTLDPQPESRATSPWLAHLSNDKLTTCLTWQEPRDSLCLRDSVSHLLINTMTVRSDILRLWYHPRAWFRFCVGDDRNDVGTQTISQ